MKNKILTPLEVLKVKENAETLPDFVIRTFNKFLVDEFKNGDDTAYINLDVFWAIVTNKSPFASISTKRQSYITQLYKLVSVHWNIIDQGNYISPKGAEWLL